MNEHARTPLIPAWPACLPRAFSSQECPRPGCGRSPEGVGARKGVGGTQCSRPHSLAIISSEALTVLLTEAPSGAGLLEVWSSPLCKLPAQIQDEISTGLVPKHLDTFIATRQSCFMSLESNKKKFLACMLCPLLISFFSSNSLVLYFTKEMARH